MTVYLVGAGPGDPGLITRRGAELLGRAEVVVYDRLVSPELLALAAPGAERVDVGKRPGDSDHQAEINALLVDRGRRGALVVRLKGGDPFVFGRGGEEVAALVAAGVAVEIVPGVSSAFAVPAYAGVPVTQRGLATAVTVITGHGAGGHPPDEDWEGLARSGGTIVILMGLAHRAQIARRLMDGGLDPATPVLVVAHGTTPRQQTVSTRLADLGEAAVEAPATIVVGAVADLRLDWFEGRPLHGRRVVVTRPRAQAAGLVDALGEAGADVTAMPVIAIEDPADGGAALVAAARRAGRYDWVLLTSANAARRFLGALGDPARLGSARLAVVGGATADEVRRLGVEPHLVPPDTEADAAGLLAALTADAPTADAPTAAAPTTDAAVAPVRALFPRAAAVPPVLAPGLRARGWEVDEVEAYRTVSTTPDAAALDAAAAADVVVFTSPSTVDAFLDLMATRPIPATVMCIGPSTADAAVRRGLSVAVVPARRDAAALTEALVAHVSAGPGAGTRPR